MKQYILRVISRESQKPLSESTLIEFGFSSENPTALSNGVSQIGELLHTLKTPEAVASFMLTHKLKNQFLLGVR